MPTKSDWDWELGHREITDVAQWQHQYNWVEEPYVSPNGEKLAAIVNLAEGEFNVCVNGDVWETTFEKIWNLRFAPDGRLAALVSDVGEWTVAVDGTAWDNKFGYVWNLMFSPNGKNIAVAVQQDMAYGMALNDVAWPETFSNMTNPTLSPDGASTAAAVQVVAFPSVSPFVGPRQGIRERIARAARRPGSSIRSWICSISVKINACSADKGAAKSNATSRDNSVFKEFSRSACEAKRRNLCLFYQCSAFLCNASKIMSSTAFWRISCLFRTARHCPIGKHLCR